MIDRDAVIAVLNDIAAIARRGIAEGTSAQKVKWQCLLDGILDAGDGIRALPASNAGEPVREPYKLPFLTQKIGGGMFIVDTVDDEKSLWSGFFVSVSGRISAEKALISGNGGRSTFHKTHFVDTIEALDTAAIVGDGALVKALENDNGQQ